MITFFDIPSTLPVNAWSPNTWKTRFSLNFKGVPYKTEWVEYPDIAPTLKKLSIGPTDTKGDGTPYFSLPAIIDVDDDTGKTKAALSESFEIAVYLDKAYPDRPRLLPDDPKKVEEIKALSKGMIHSVFPLLVIIAKATLPLLNEASREHFSRARAMNFFDVYHTETLEEIPLMAEHKAELWGATKKCFDDLELKLNGKDEEAGPWYLGSEISFADFVIGGVLVWARTIFGEASEEWTDIRTWNGGRWRRFLERLDAYQNV